VSGVEPLEELGRYVAERQNAAPSAAEHERLRATVVERAFEPRSSRVGRAWTLGLVAAAASLLVASFILLERSPRPLSFYVGVRQVKGAIGSWMSAEEASNLPVRFSDGTRAELLPSGRARVVSVSPFCASIVVESGRARFDVVHRPNGEWRVNTGPFVVHVTGTRFEVEWHPDRDTFVLELYEGHVRVSGCNLDEPYAVRAGERLEASCGRREFRVGPVLAEAADGTIESRSLAPEASSAGPGHPAASPAPEANASESGTGVLDGRSPAAALLERTKNGDRAAPSTRSRTERRDDPDGTHETKPPEPASADFGDRWIDLAKRGLYADAFAAAEERGFDRERERCTEPELLLLADSARFSRHVDRARLAYQSVRQRFPGTPGAALAAFQLGRDDFDRRSDYPEAERWLRVYLDEAPTGPLSAAALGRLMEAEIRQGNRAEARKFAQAYIERFPSGPHAEAAARVLGPAPNDARR